jgi:phosphatidylserine/phosphatidylglycerophosphate/cardiolipin synthase-like enzyme
MKKLVLTILLLNVLCVYCGCSSLEISEVNPRKVIATSSSNKVNKVSFKPDIYFSPTNGCVEAIINQIDDAKIDIKIQAYVLTDTNIVSSLIDAKKRGVNVNIIIDLFQSHGKYGIMATQSLLHEGINVYTDGKHAIAHNKIIIIDDYITITGSYNFTKGAELRNAENLLIFRNNEIASKYANNWTNHLNHSIGYK